MRQLSMKAGSFVVVVVVALAVAGCEDAQTEARPAAPSPTAPVAVAASDRGAPYVSSKYLRDVRFDCAPNDAPAVTGTWTGPDDPVTITIMDEQGQDHDSVRASSGPFVLRIRSNGLVFGAAVNVQARSDGGEPLDTLPVVLRYGPRGAC